jgi:hypothetical protein
MIKIDDVYQKVLAVANKEQRGYLTPQEFNLFADHAQKEIFEQYFYDINQFKRAPGNDTNHADMVSLLDEKISLFKIEKGIEDGNSLNDFAWNDINLTNEAPDLYRLDNVRVVYQNQNAVNAELISLKDLAVIAEGPLTRYTKKRPVYTRYSTNNNPDRLKIYPLYLTSKVEISYIKKPTKPNWSYQIVNEKPFFLNNDNSQNFELHPSEEGELVYRILALAGIMLEKPGLIQAAVGLEGAKVQQEKQ